MSNNNRRLYVYDVIVWWSFRKLPLWAAKLIERIAWRILLPRLKRVEAEQLPDQPWDRIERILDPNRKV